MWVEAIVERPFVNSASIYMGEITHALFFVGIKVFVGIYINIWASITVYLLVYTSVGMRKAISVGTQYRKLSMSLSALKKRKKNPPRSNWWSLKQGHWPWFPLNKNSDLRWLSSSSSVTFFRDVVLKGKESLSPSKTRATRSRPVLFAPNCASLACPKRCSRWDEMSFF